MKTYFHGSVGDVTGAADNARTNRADLPVDRGLFQGGKREWEMS